jgi:hypothetical protein
LHAKSLAGGTERQVLDSVWLRAFCIVEDGIYHIAAVNKEGFYPLLFFNFATQEERLIINLDARPYHGLTISPDRKTILFSAHKPQNQDLMLIENFR